MSKLASLIKMAGRNPESKAAAIATAATTGITIAKFLGKRSIYGAIAGVGVSLIAKKLMEKQAGKPKPKTTSSSMRLCSQTQMRPSAVNKAVR